MRQCRTYRLEGIFFGKMNKFGVGNPKSAKTKVSHLYFGIFTIFKDFFNNVLADIFQF